MRHLLRCIVSLGGLSLIFVLPHGAAAQAPPDPLRIVDVGTFTKPIFVAAPPADIRRVFVVERDGKIRVVRDGTVLPAPFLDISPVSTDIERGFLSMAFAPDYATSGKFYVFYTAVDDPATPADNELGDIYIDEYQRSATDPDVADPTSRRNVLIIEHSARSNHNGGTLQFGPDGHLYISVGDADQRLAAQALDTLLGKILRIDPTPSGAEPYDIPADNPFVGTAGARPEIWSYGLRNPFRFSLDRENGDIAIGDVGQQRFEEVNYVPRSAGGGARANFGWRITEGNVIFETGEPVTEENAPENYVPPAFVRSREEGFTALTGGVVVRDPALHPLFGRYLYADYFFGAIQSATLAPGGSTDHRTVPGLPAFQNLAGFGEDACGRVYMAHLNGTVRRLTTTGQCVPPEAACTLLGNEANNVLSGTPGRDVICGRGGNDTLRGMDGDDVLVGGPGNDSLDGGPGADVHQGSAGVDTADYQQRLLQVRVSVGSGGGNDGGAGEQDDVQWDVEKVVGGSGNDTITGSFANNVLYGRGGDDRIFGGSGNDTFFGGDGADRLSGDEGADWMDGGAGADVFIGGTQADRVSYATRTAPLSLTIGNGPDDGESGEGDDIGGDVERLSGGAGNDDLVGNDSANLLSGLGGDDELQGGGGADVLEGRGGADMLAGGAGTDLAEYGERSARVVVTIGAGADDGEAGEGDDVNGDVEKVRGGRGGDELTGSGAAETLIGGAGADRLEGGGGSDTHDGGDGDDQLFALDGFFDKLLCGAGTDSTLADPFDNVAADCEG